MTTTKSYVKYVRYYFIRRKLLHYQARAVYYIIRQKLLDYEAASLLHYRAKFNTLSGSKLITLSYDFITLSGVFITLSCSYYINRRLLQYRL